MQKMPNSNAPKMGKKEDKSAENRDLFSRYFPATTQAIATNIDAEKKSSLISGNGNNEE
ncbi:MAG: hypothetical protein OXC17_06895 [Aestuariivita sp.]|nr:hypothetical protein [Aestuariivita sp.]